MSYVAMSAVEAHSSLYGASLLSPSLYESLPIPISTAEGRLEVAFLYAHGEILERDGGLSLWAPSYLCAIDPASARIQTVRRVKPGDFGLDAPTDAPIGTARARGEREDEEYLTERAKLLSALDRLLPLYARGDPPSEPAREELAKAFAAIAEPPLVPYYRAMGSFLRWASL